MTSLVSEVTRTDYSGDDVTTEFNTGFWVRYAADIVVVRTNDDDEEETLVLDTDYTVTDLLNHAGATVTLIDADGEPEALPTDWTLFIYRAPALTNLSDFSASSTLFPPTVTQVLDYCAAQAQFLQDQIDRCIRLPISRNETGFSASSLGNAAARAGKALLFDGSGDPIEGEPLDGSSVTVSAFMLTVLDDTTVGAALTTLGFSTLGQNLRDDTTLAAFLTTLGIAADMRTFLATANDAAARTELGVPTSLAVTAAVFDEWIPASAMVGATTNPAATGSVETTVAKIMQRTLDFDKTTQEFAHFTHVFPKGWNKGTVTFIPYWTAAAGVAAETVVWALQGIAISNDDAIDTAFGTEQTSSDVLIAAGDLHVGPASAAITIGGTPAEGDVVFFRVKRVVASDNLDADALLLGIKLIYSRNADTDA